jgi:poly-gamma-glutamate capsule biosynthesis protein CapA/YwtB (metallophosphatase superfamily)
VQTRRWRGGLGVFLALQVLFLAAPGFTLFRVDSLAMAVPGPPVDQPRPPVDLAAPPAGQAGPSPGAPGAPPFPLTTPGLRRGDTIAAGPDRPTEGPVTLAFAGDVHFEDFLASGLDDAPDPGVGGSGLLDPLAEMMAGADVAVVNLETAITERGEPQPKEYTFRAPTTALRALREAGVDAVSMANNHGLDFGPVGLVDSLAASDAADLPVVGIGLDDRAAYRPWITTVRGWRVAVVAATQVLDDAATWTAGPGWPGLASAKDRDRLVAEVAAARAAADTVVVFLHWGIEGDSCPSLDQTTLADELVAAGADVVVGGHAHRLQGAGRKGNALVAYGLGNAVFYSSGGPSTDSGVLEVTVEGRRVLGYRWQPARLQGGVATALDGEEAADALARWEARRECTDLQP